MAPTRSPTPPALRHPAREAVDAVLVAYGDPAPLRRAVLALAGEPDVAVVVVDHDPDAGAAAALRGTAARIVTPPDNRGFGAGCNRGAFEGSAPLLLLLNPDARLEPGALEALRAALAADRRIAVAAPRIEDDAGVLQHSQRRTPGPARTLAMALYLHRLWPGADELVRDAGAYARAGDPDWVSGAALLVRRSAFDRVGGFDEGFFLYREDADLCRRLRAAGFGVRYVPEALVRHAGGQSAPRARLRGVHAASRVRYAALHERRAGAALERAAVALGEGTHAVGALGRGRRGQARGHARGLAAALRGRARP